MHRSRRGQWWRNPTVSACAVVAGLATLSSCSSLHRAHVPPRESVSQEQVPQKSASEGLPPGVHIVDAATVELETQRVAAALGRSRHESIAAPDVGYYLDVLQGRLQQAVGEHVDVRRDGQAVSLEILGRVMSDTDGSRLDSVTQDILTKFGRVLVEYHATVVNVRVLDANAKDIDPVSVAPTAVAVVRRLVQEGAAATHLLLVARDSTRAGKSQPAASTDICIALKIQPIPRA